MYAGPQYGQAEAGVYGAQSGYGDGYDGGNMGAFGSKSVRMAFIRKVYGLLSIQLTISVGFIAVFVFSDGMKGFARANSWLVWVAFGATFVVMIMLACCGDLRRQTPHNYILLFLFTLAESFLLGVISSMYKTEAVFIAVVITAIVCLALTLFAFQTKIDFTVFNGIAFVAVLVLMVFGICVSIWPNRTAMLIYSALGALIFSAYLVIDTQMMIGGTHSVQISEEEYVFATLNLYLDIVQLFLFILQIVGEATKN